MPQVTMPDGTVVEMPDQLDPALGARLRAYQQEYAAKQLADTIPVPGGGLRNPDGTPYVAPPPAQTPQSGKWADTLADFGHDLGISPISDPLIGGGEMVLSGITNVGGKILGGVAGTANMLGTPVDNLFRDQPIDPMDMGANTSRAIEDFFTYHPARPGQELMEPIAAGGEYVMKNLPDTPAVQTVVPAFAETAATLLPLKGALATRPSGLASTLEPRLKAPGAVSFDPRRSGAATQTAFENAVPRLVAEARIAGVPIPESKPVVQPGEGLGTALADLRAAGYPVRPSDVQRFNPGKDVPGTTREKFAPEAARERTVEKAQVKTQEIAGKEMGLKPGERLDENWDKLRAPEIETYRLAEDVAAQKDMLPELETALADGAAIVRRELLDEGGEPSITRTISALRRRATKELNDERPEVNDRGYDTLAAAERIEKAFGKQLEHVGEPQMLDRYQAAREKLAKIHDYESISTAGIVDASKAAKLNKKFQGRLTGGLKMIATAGEYLPKATTSTMRAADPGAIGVPHSKPGLIAKATGFISSKIPGLDVTTPEFQAKHFGAEAPPDFISRYGRREVPAPEAVPQQELGLGEPMVLKPPPGISRPLVEDTPELGNVMIDEPLFTNAPRTVGFPDLNFQDVMALIEREAKKKRKE